jgi:cytochrome c oxidase subunit 2
MEKAARGLIIGLILGLIAVTGIAYWLSKEKVIVVHAAMPENGGFSPADLSVEAGKLLRLRLVSDDVVHGFAIGQSDRPAIELLPGQASDVTLVFDRPGKYVFYCTRWCGVNHWRMRGAIEVTGETAESVEAQPPLYVELGLNIDAQHPAEAVPQDRPSAKRGAAPGAGLPDEYLDLEYYHRHSPSQAWLGLRDEPSLEALSDQEVWDLVAYIWSSHTTPQALQEGKSLYTANCAACHGETGEGDGVMADDLISEGEASEGGMGGEEHTEMAGHTAAGPVDFTDAAHLLGASPAVLHGKIVRGGMGTGMPYWGPIFTDEQIWALVSYLWGFQFDFGG